MRGKSQILSKLRADGHITDEEYKVLNQEPSEDAISRKSIKQKLQEHHDFFVNAYGGFSNLPLNDKSRVDEITNCIAMVVNEPPVTPQSKIGHWIPVSERLPDLWDERYLVSLAWGGVGVMEYKSTGFHNYGSFAPVPIESVIAWMPLPEPYKGEREDELRVVNCEPQKGSDKG